MSDGSLPEKPEPEQPQVPSPLCASEQAHGNAEPTPPECSPATETEDEIDDGGWLCI